MWVRKPSVYRPPRWRAIGGHSPASCSSRSAHFSIRLTYLCALTEKFKTMTRISIPAARRNGALGAFRKAWTAPTSLIGHGVAWLLRCGRPQRVGGKATRAWLYCLPAERFKGLRGIAIGHVIILEPAFLAARGRWVLAHELAHTRQHDWLGPAYLPVHAMLLLLSAVIFFFRPVAKFSPWHAYNPLERVLICVPIDVIAVPPAPEGALADSVLCAFGLTTSPICGGG